VNLHAEDALDLDEKVGFTFPEHRRELHDVDSARRHRGAARDCSTIWTSRSRCRSQAFKGNARATAQAAISLATDFRRWVKGSKLGLIGFFKLFTPESEKGSRVELRAP